MKKSIINLLLCLTIISLPAFSQDFIGSEYWDKLSEPEKVSFVSGMDQCVNTALFVLYNTNNDISGDIVDKITQHNLSPVEISKRISIYYMIQCNREDPLLLVYLIAIGKIKKHESDG